jgi:hypothetical protein
VTYKFGDPPCPLSRKNEKCIESPEMAGKLMKNVFNILVPPLSDICGKKIPLVSMGGF